MPYSIIEVDGIQVDPATKRFPIEVHANPHALDGNEHIGVLGDYQIPTNIMRTASHHIDPHNQTIDGRRVSVDGSKLDTIEPGAEVNNLTDMQAQDLTSGAHTNWHHHDTFYYRKGELQVSGSAQVAWGNLTGVPATFAPSAHDHNDLYYTETELDAGQLDNRYYTESEVDVIASGLANKVHNHDDLYYTEAEINTLLSSKSDTSHNHNDAYYTKTQLDIGQLDARYYTESEIDVKLQSVAMGIKGAVNTFSDLPTTSNVGDIYIVRQTVNTNEEGFYRWSGTAWEFLANNTGLETHNDLDGLNIGDYQHLTLAERTDLTDGGDTLLHIHDSRYFTETESDARFAPISHNHNDAYYTKTLLDAGQLDSRYYTKTNIQTGGQASVAWDNLTGVPTTFTPSAHNHNDIYYTETESDARFAPISHNHDSSYYTKTLIDSNYYTKAESDARYISSSHNHNDLYYTETEIDTKLGQITVATVAANDPATDITALELETLTNGSNADGLHTHSFTGGGASTLDEAYGTYGGGRTISVDHGPVQLSAQDGFAPLKLTPISYTPNQWLGGGELCIRGGDLYCYDATRGKWLSVDTTSLTVSGNSSTTSGYLYIDNVIMTNTIGICMPYNGTIVGLSFSNGSGNAYGTMDIRVWGSTIEQVSFDGHSNVADYLNLNVSAGDVVQVYCNANGNGRPNKPVVLLLFKKRI